MSRFLGNFLLLLLLIMPTTVLFVEQAKGGSLAFAQDAMEGEDDDVMVETEAAGDDEVPDEEVQLTGKEKEDSDDDDEEEQALKPSPDADTFILFTKPNNPLELPAGKQVRILVGFTNKGNLDFLVDSMEASFRYPQDYSFFLQNFTTMTYNTVIEPKKQATFEYGFVPNEAFSSRPFGLTVTINYKDADGTVFQNAVFNETIQVVEPDEGLDGETMQSTLRTFRGVWGVFVKNLAVHYVSGTCLTIDERFFPFRFFLYVFLAAIVILLLVGAQQLVANFGRKRLSKPRQPVEMGTQNSDVDYDWLPKETLQGMNKSPRRSPKQSPRQRRNLRSTGQGEE